jgi:hypothetical protein
MDKQKIIKIHINRSKERHAMQADTVSVWKLFQNRIQYRVPFFQRPYVWNKSDQWERLWNDILDKAELRLDGVQPTPHFLGAAVLEPQMRVGLIGVDALDVIDGQQRITTLQYFLASLVLVLRQEDQQQLITIVNGCLRNPNPETMRYSDVEIYKLWPTFRDRENFVLVMEAENIDQLRTSFPNSFTQSGALKKVGVVHPPALEAILFFAEQINNYIQGDDEIKRISKLQAITESVLGDLVIVSISLGENDDPQIIFETLNGHGAQLHATDLIRNYIFMRADKERLPAQSLYDDLWGQFESDGFWSESQRRGRLNKPRIEWFIQSALQASVKEEVEMNRLYAAYKDYVANNSLCAKDQLIYLKNIALFYQKMISACGNDPISKFGRRVSCWDASTTHAIALKIATSRHSESIQDDMYNCIVSYFVRRAVCGLTTKNYNKIFLGLIKKFCDQDVKFETLYIYLSSLEGDASRWPRDDEFKRAWLNNKVYPGSLDAGRSRSLLKEIEIAMRTTRTEETHLTDDQNLDVEHILPINWHQHWPLPDLSLATESDSSAAATAALGGDLDNERNRLIIERDRAKATIGNLTLLHFGVNRSIQNRCFHDKREALFVNSNLHLNRDLMRIEEWNEGQINNRGIKLFEYALKLWPGPNL